MDFLQVVTENKLVDVRSLLQAGFDVNSLIAWNAKRTFTPLISKRIVNQPELLKKIQIDEEYYAHPLNLAVIGGHEDMVRLLLSAGADINLKDGRGRTAIMCAIYGLDLDSSCINGANAPLIAQTHPAHLDIMRNCLLGHHNLHVATLDSAQNDANGITPLCMASYLGKTEIMTLLLEDGRVNVDGADNKNATPLMYAARDGNATNVKLLLQYDASPDVTDDHGWSALQWGARNQEIVLLCEEALRSRRPEVPVLSTSSQYVKYPTNYTRLFSLINSLPPFSSSLSHLQLNPLPSPTEDVHEALDSSFDLQKAQAALLVAIKAHDHLSIQSLLLTPPIPASANQQTFNTTILVNHHDAKTGLTPLHHAIRSKPLPSLETVTMLFQAGADINAQSAYGRTALHHLCRFGVDKENNVWGIQKGAQSVRADSKRGRRPQIECVGTPTPSISTQTRFTEEEGDGKTQFDETYRLSMQSGTSSRSSASEGRLSYASNDSLRNSEAPFGTYENNVELDSTANACRHLARCASLLIRLGALVNHPDPTGNTPLHFAAEFGGVVEVIEVLVHEGSANITYKNKRGFTPLEVVKSEAAKKALEVLLKEAAQDKITPLNGVHAASIHNDHSASLLNRSTLRTSTRSAFHRQSSIISPTESLPPSRHLKTLIFGSQPTKLDHVIQIPQTLEELREQFIQILRNIFFHLTTGTKSIEGLLANITSMVLQPPNMDSDQQRRHYAHLRASIDGLRTQLEQTYALFDITDEQYQSVVVWYQQDMDGIEAFNMELWERCEVERENIEAVYEAYEKLCDRVKDLECDNDQLARKVEALRRKGNRVLEKACKSVSDRDSTNESERSSMENIQFIMEAIMFLESDSRRHPSNAKRIQQQKMMEEFDSLIIEHSEQVEKEIADINMNSLKNSKTLNNPESENIMDDIEYSRRLREAQTILLNRWKASKERIEKNAEDEEDAEPQQEGMADFSSNDQASGSMETTIRFKNQDSVLSAGKTEESVRELSISPSSTKERASLLRSEKPQRLNHLELTFDILMSNLHEIEKDIYEADKRIHQILSSKRNMYENRLDLEDQLNSIDKVHSPEQLTQRVEELRVGRNDGSLDDGSSSDGSNGTRQQVSTELSAIMDETAQLFEEQQRLISERATLDNEHQEKRAEIEDIKSEIGQVRPAELLSGLLERLETEEPNLVTIQKDWKEDVECVSEVVFDDDVDCNASPDNDIYFGKGSIEIRCRLVKLESSLHTLKISCESQLQSLKSKLSESQAVLLQSERELSQGRERLLYMCEDLSDIQRQVFVLKRELEIVIQNRKEEIIKVWEVVNDVRDGVLMNYPANGSIPNGTNGDFSPMSAERNDDAQDQEQHDAILNELEQYHIVHENLLSALEQQRKDQTKISSQTLPNIIATLHSQQEALLASDEPSIMESTLVLGDLIDSVRKRELESSAMFSHLSGENQTIRSSFAMVKRATTSSVRSNSTYMEDQSEGLGSQRLPRQYNSVRRSARGGFGLPLSTKSRSSIRRMSNLRSSLLSDAQTLSTLASGEVNSGMNRPTSGIRRGRPDSQYPRSLVSPDNSIIMSPTLTSSLRQDGTRASLVSNSSISSLSSLHQANMLQKASRLKAANASKLSHHGSSI
ncbi:hypothetical protein BC943DRAFT_363723 [Umbelopsis sp. AD052]|nr:hypothetical protein BC943DRAFT_363723 [Umbelopsis sp. AD052]